MAAKSKRIIMWSAPRCLSSVFFCSMSTLTNCKCFFEPYAGPYYWGPEEERVSQRYDSTFPIPEELLCSPTYSSVTDMLRQNYTGKDIVFAKEHAFSIPESMYADILTDEFIHTFLIRDPERAVYSKYKIIASNNTPGYNNFDPSEVGFGELYNMYNYLKERTGVAPPVIQAEDLQRNPEQTMQTFCKVVGIEYKTDMTTWEPMKIPGVPRFWREFFGTVEESSGFIMTNPAAPNPIDYKQMPNEMVESIKTAYPYYKVLQSSCITP